MTTSHPYEFPLTEFIRTTLKINRLDRFFQEPNTCNTEEDIRNLVVRTLELHALIGRSELKNEIIKEVDKRILRLNRLKDIPEIDLSTLDKTVAHLHAALKDLKSIPANSFSNPLPYMIDAVKQRLTIPGGQFEFDLPGYQHWLGQGPGTCEAQILEVLSSLKPITKATSLLLDLIRNSAIANTETANNGVFQLTDSSNTELIIIQTSGRGKLYPEISGGKHRVFIRFMEFSDLHQKANQTNKDITFRLKTCHI